MIRAILVVLFVVLFVLLLALILAGCATVGRNGHRGGIAPLHPIRGASEDDVLGAIKALLSLAPFCIPCLVARTGLGAWDVEIAMRALIRTSDVELAGVCESCKTRPAFRARHPRTTAS